MQGPLGEHFILELYDCTRDTLDNLLKIQSTLLKAARIAGATIINHHFHKFSPQGVSGVIVIAESHLSIHTWPEHGYAAIDLFTCNMDMQLEGAFQLIKQEFKPLEMNIQRIERGILNPELRRVDPSTQIEGFAL